MLKTKVTIDTYQIYQMLYRMGFVSIDAKSGRIMRGVGKRKEQVYKNTFRDFLKSLGFDEVEWTDVL